MATYTRRINLYINGLEVRNNVKAIRAEVIQLNRTLNIATIGSKEYNAAMHRLRVLQPILDQHNAQLRQTSFNLTSLKGIANAFNKYMPMVMGTIGTLAGVVFATQRAAQAFGEFDDRIADVMKVTALTREQVLALNEELKKIDTRTAQDTLLELSWVAGKLGITAQEDILGFVRAADQITVALAKDLGGNAEEAIRAMGKAVNIFGLEEVYGIEEALLRVGSAVNELGMASVAQEGFLVKFIERVAGIAPMAGVNIQNILGLAAALDMFGQKSEVSATAYSKLMSMMATNTEEMARIVGMSIAEWTELFTRDANEAMLVLFESIGNEGTASFQGLVSLLGDAELDGQRMTQVMGTLVKNVKTIREQQELSTRAFAEGTSVTEEFNIKNNNAQAIIEKKQKALAILRVELGEKLFPIYISGFNVLERFMRSVVGITEFVYENRHAISVLIKTLLAYQVALRATNVINKISLGEFASLRAAILIIKLAYYDLTRQTIKATAAQAQLNAMMLANPTGALVAGMVAFGVALHFLLKGKEELATQEKTLQGIMGDTVTELEKQTIELDALYEQLLKTNPESDRRKELIKQINEIHPDLLKGINGERASIETLKGAYDDYIENLKKSIELNIILERIREQMSKVRELEQKANEASGRKRIGFLEEWREAKALLGSLEEEYKFKFDISTLGTQRAEILSEIRKIEAALKMVDEGFMLARPRVEGMPEPEKGFFFDNQWFSENDEVQIAKLRSRLDELKLSFEELSEAQEEATLDGGGIKPKKTGPDYSEDAEERALLGLLQQRARDRRLLNERMQQGITDTDKLYQGIRFRTEQEYNEAKLKMQISYASGRLSNADRDGEKYLELQKDLAEKVLKLALDEGKRLEDIRKEGLKTTPFDEAQQEYINRLIALDLFFDQEGQLTADQARAIESIYTEHLKTLDKLNADHFKEQFDDQGKALEQRMSVIKLKHAQEFAQIETLEQAKAYLRGRISDEEISRLTTFYDAKKAIIAAQEDEQNKIQLEYFSNALNEMTRLIESMEFDFYDPLMPEAFLSDETKDAVLTRLKEVRDEYIKLLTELGKKPPDENAAQRLRRINLDIFGFTQDDWERFFDNLEQAKNDTETLKDLMLMGAMAFANAWSDANRIVANIENKRLEDYRRQNDQKLKSLDGNLKAGLISEEFYNHQKERLAEQLARKEAILARKQAAREKAVALFSAIVNTAVAVTKYLGRPILAALIAAAGAAQVGIIASTPLPQIPGAEEGGQMIKVVRQQDGRPFNARYSPAQRGWIKKPTIITGENGAREYVIPEEGARNPNIRPFIDMIERARLNGSLPTLNPMANASTRIPGREQGGYLSQQTSSVKPSTTPAVYHDERTNALLEQNALILAELNKQISRGIRAEVALTGRKGLIESQEEYDQLMANANL